MLEHLRLYKPMISVTILTKNNAKTIQRTLDSLTSFSEVLIYDTGSTDETLSLAKQYPNVTIHQSLGPFEGFGKTHNHASSLAKYPWILSIDSDEALTPELAQEIQSLSLNPNHVYSVPRKNFYNERWIKGCGWSPDYQKRLYHKASTSFDDAYVHEAIISKHLKVIPLKSALCHYSYTSVADFLSKMQFYSQLFAQQHQGKRKSSCLHAVSHGAFAFFKSYILKKGFLDGPEGFEISLYNANTAYYKYLKLNELNKRNHYDRKT